VVCVRLRSLGYLDGPSGPALWPWPGNLPIALGGRGTYWEGLESIPMRLNVLTWGIHPWVSVRLWWLERSLR